MPGHIVEFVASGTPRGVARAIEADASGRGAVSVLVVPWESDEVTICMAITLVKTDGWAIEHTDLGTVQLTDLGDERTGVAIVAHDTDHPEQERLTVQLQDYGRHLQRRFEARAEGAGSAQ
jgi:hypothetical protein